MVIFLSPTQLSEAIAAKVEFICARAVAVTASGERRQLAEGASIGVGETVIREDARVQCASPTEASYRWRPNPEFRSNAYF